MADNSTLNSGSGGDTIGTDNISSVHYQRVKIIHGTDGVNDGDTAEELPLPVSAALRTDVMQNANTALTPKYAIIDAATSGNNTLIAAVAAKNIRVLAYVLVASDAVTARFEDGAGGTALSGQMQLGANGGVSAGFNPAGWFETSDNTLLNLELSDATSVDGHLTYVEF